MTEQEFNNRPSDLCKSKGLVYKVLGRYNPVTRTIMVEIKDGVFPMSLSLVSEFLSPEKDPEYFL